MADEIIAAPLSIDGLIASNNPSNLLAIVQAISAMDEPIVREGYIGSVVKKFNVPKKMILQMLQAMVGQQEDEAETKTTIKADFEGLIDLVSDHQGNIVFWTINSLTGELGQYSSWNDGTTEFIPPTLAQIPYMPPKLSEIMCHYKIEDRNLFRELGQYLKRFCYVTDGQILVVGNMILATYLQDHSDINYIPIISLIGEPERGKSRLGMAATFASFRGVVMNGIREAHIIRLAEDYSATIFIDLRAAWKKVVAEKCEDIILGRYEKGHQVMRVISPEKGAYADSRFFKAYGPTFLASNEPLDRILDTRCIPLIMGNHPAEYEKPTEQKGLVWRERLVAWKAKTILQSLPAIEPVQGLKGRFWDISSTLLRICSLVFPEGYEALKTELQKIAQEKVEARRSSWEGTIAQHVLSFLNPSIIGSGSYLIKLADILNKINMSLPNDRKISSQYLGLKLKNMSIKTKHIQGHSHVIIDKSLIDNLREQYGLVTASDQPTTGTASDGNIINKEVN